MKKCTKCLLEKDDNCFNVRSENKHILESHCKSCKKLGHDKWYQRTKTSPKSRFAVAKSAAKSRGLEFILTREEFAGLISNPCHYCEDSIDSEMGVGLDRLDNKVGYTLQNVVPCCGRCNFGKTDRFTSDEWKVMISALLKYKASMV